MEKSQKLRPALWLQCMSDGGFLCEVGSRVGYEYRGGGGRGVEGNKDPEEVEIGRRASRPKISKRICLTDTK